MFNPLRYRPRLSPKDEAIASMLKSSGFYHHAHYESVPPEDSEFESAKLIRCGSWRIIYDEDEQWYLNAECGREIFCKHLDEQEAERNLEATINAVRDAIVATGLAFDDGLFPAEEETTDRRKGIPTNTVTFSLRGFLLSTFTTRIQLKRDLDETIQLFLEWPSSGVSLTDKNNNCYETVSKVLLSIPNEDEPLTGLITFHYLEGGKQMTYSTKAMIWDWD